MTPTPVPAPAPHLPLVPAEELAARAERLARRLSADDLDGAFLLHPSSHFWISGTLGQGWPFVTADGAAALAIRASVGRASHESPLPQAAARRPADLGGVLAELGTPVRGKVGVEMDVVPAADLARLQRAFPEVEFHDVSLAIREVRSVKSPYELEWVTRAGRIVSEVMDEALPPKVRAGVREIELCTFIEAEMRARRHQGVVRLRRWNLEMHFGTVSSGISACYPCYFDGPDGQEALYPAVQQGGGERRIDRGAAILVDYVGAAGGYLADRTRVFCVGEPAREATDAHAFCESLLGEIADRLRPGAVPSAVYEEVHGIVADSPWADRFMGWGENQVSFLGHGIGLDLDEFPVLAPRFDRPLEAGQVIAVEPKIFLGEAGGVGVEDTFVVTPEGARNVTEGPLGIRTVPE